jgi:hypothetical protein
VASLGCIASLGLMVHNCLCPNGKQKEQVCAKSKKDTNWLRTQSLEKGGFNSLKGQVNVQNLARVELFTLLLYA